MCPSVANVPVANVPVANVPVANVPVANVPVANVPYCCKYALLLQMCQLPTIPKFCKMLKNILNFAEKLSEMLSGRVSNVPTKFLSSCNLGWEPGYILCFFRGFIHVAYVPF